MFHMVYKLTNEEGQTLAQRHQLHMFLKRRIVGKLQKWKVISWCFNNCEAAIMCNLQVLTKVSNHRKWRSVAFVQYSQSHVKTDIWHLVENIIELRLNESCLRLLAVFNGFWSKLCTRDLERLVCLWVILALMEFSEVNHIKSVHANGGAKY